MKILKKLKDEEVLLSKKIGKSEVYKLNLDNDYTRHLISFLLLDETNKFRRWKDEFKELFKEGRVIILYGSTIRDYSKAKDIDIMIIGKKEESGEIYKQIAERQRFLPKKIHIIVPTPEDFLRNIRKEQKAIIDIVKNAIILYGQSKYIELIKNVTSI